MRQLGAAVEYAGENGRFPLNLQGGGIRGGEARISASKSSQFASGLLMAAPYAEAPVTLHPDGRKQWPYVGITVGPDAGLRRGGRRSKRTASPSHPALYTPQDYEVEPDASGASYFMAAAAVTGGRVRIPGLGSSSPQGDLRFAEVLRDMGCRVEIAPHTIEVTGPDRLQGVEVDMNAFSDTMITLAAIAPFATRPHHHKKRSPYPPAGDRPPLRRRNRTEPPRHSHTNNPLIYTHNTWKDTAWSCTGRTATTGWRWHLR